MRGDSGVALDADRVLLRAGRCVSAGHPSRRTVVVVVVVVVVLVLRRRGVLPALVGARDCGRAAAAAVRPPPTSPGLLTGTPSPPSRSSRPPPREFRIKTVRAGPVPLQPVIAAARKPAARSVCSVGPKCAGLAGFNVHSRSARCLLVAWANRLWLRRRIGWNVCSERSLRARSSMMCSRMGRNRPHNTRLHQRCWTNGVALA